MNPPQILTDINPETSPFYVNPQDTAHQQPPIINDDWIKPPAYRMTAPERFDGDRTKFKTFILQLRLIFMVNPHSFKSEPIKIAALGNLLTGVAATWFNRFIEFPEKYPDALTSFDGFAERMAKFFGPIDRTSEATLEINNLTQGYKTVTEYASLFLQCAEDLSWNDAALMNHFQRGLSNHVKDMLVMLPDVDSTLTSLINHAIQFDNRYRENSIAQGKNNANRKVEFSGDRARKQTNHSRPWHQTSRSSPYHSYPRQYDASNFRPNNAIQQRLPYVPPSTTRVQNDGAPMELDSMESKPNTRNNEREYRYSKGLCLTCGQPGHLRAACPQRRHNAGLEIFHQPLYNNYPTTTEDQKN
jgi:hypothetical protein